jgi:hypothetical protein
LDPPGPWKSEGVLWNPGNYTSQKYIRYVQALEKELSIESGLVDLQTDEIEVDPDRLEAFARRLLEELAQSNHEVNAAQIRPVLGRYSQTNHPVKTQIWAVLGPAVVMADRAGRPLNARTPRECELLAEARTLSGLSR